MLKEKSNRSRTNSKKGSVKSDYLGPLASGLNRRAFLKTTTAISLLAGLTACKPSIPKLDGSAIDNQIRDIKVNKRHHFFSKEQQITLDAVQMQLFPEDGNGPSARDLNAIEYLEWAMTDPQNIEDGDPVFIRKGISWLDDLANQTEGEPFIKLSDKQKDKVLKQIANSNAGENWLGILIYYLSEALTLDPFYGGNTGGIGWQWLEHQPGFPRPVNGKTYRDFD